MTSPLIISKQNQINQITLNRPEKCNALNGELIHALQEALYAAGRDASCRAVILNGAGDHFCAGADIAWMKKLAHESFELGLDDARQLASLLYQMYSFPKPIITIVQGKVMGGGLGLVACSDVVIGTKDSQYCFSEVKIGLIPAVVSPYIITAMGEHVARYYFLTAESFDANEAHRLGLIHQKVEKEKVEEVTQQLIAKILKNSPEALAAVKRLLPLINQQEITLELSEKTAEILAKLRVSEQALEGLNAFLEKREPTWSIK